MDIAVHWGVLRHLRKEINANAGILITAIIFDVIVLATFISVKASTDMIVIYAAITGIFIVYIGERFFLRKENTTN